MNINEAVARGYNFFVVAVLGIVAGSLSGDIFNEGPWAFKLDEFLIITVGVVAVAWYLIGQHRYERSFVPLVLAVAGFATKMVGLTIEFGDKVEAGDDFTIVGVLLLLVIVAGVAYFRTRVLVPEPATTDAARQTPAPVNR